MSARAIVDWCSFTFPQSAVSDLGPLQAVRNVLESWFEKPLAIEVANGRHGYKQSACFKVYHCGELVNVAVMAWDGNKDTVYVSISGTGCSLIRRWHYVKAYIDAVGGQLTRVDTAVDFFEGEFTVDLAQELYASRQFALTQQPSHKCIGSWLDTGQGGRTLEVGKRQNGKMARIYEKGKQLGAMNHDWVRFEVEWHNVDRVLPLDMLTEPGKYFSGAYPCTDGLLELVVGEAIKTLEKEGEITIERLMECVKIAYGKLLHVCSYTTPNHEELFNRLAVEGVPRRLQKAALHAVNPAGAKGNNHENGTSNAGQGCRVL